MATKQDYMDMQKESYTGYCDTATRARTVCVGNWEAHQNYPYEDWIMKHFGAREQGIALDFGCGVGRMMARMIRMFTFVDGADLMQENLDYAKEYLDRECAGLSQFYTEPWYQLYKTDGNNCPIPHSRRYDLIYSTICLQHVASHTIRCEIIKDLRRLLKANGQMVLQFGYGWPSRVGWFDDNYDAKTTNGGTDVSIPNQKALDKVVADFKNQGFDVVYEIAPSPHPRLNNYHPNWIFFYLTKNSFWSFLG